MTTRKATFGAGCIWGVEQTFRQIEGMTATAIEPAPPFWRAEEYHQQYLPKRGRTSCASSVHP